MYYILQMIMRFDYNFASAEIDCIVHHDLAFADLWLIHVGMVSANLFDRNIPDSDVLSKEERVCYNPKPED